jgi:hypothetical protein
VSARGAFVFVFAAASTVGAVASAQEPSTGDKAVAERLYNDGIALMRHKDYANACPKFAESLRVESGIGTMLHLADCYEKAGRLASAWAQFREAAEIAEKDRDGRASVARERANALEPKLSTLTIVVPPPSSADGLEITRDGSVVGRGQWGTPIPLDAGAHTIGAAAPHHVAWSTRIDLAAEHATQTVSVPALAAEPPPDATAPPVPVVPGNPPPSRDGEPAPALPPPPPTSGFSTRQILGLSLGGAGIIGLGLGTYFGLHAKSLDDDSNTGGCMPNDHCTQAGGDLRSSARDSAMGANVSYALGLAALAGGAVIYFTAPKEGASEGGPRVGLSAQPLGREGAILVGRASW